MRQGGYGRARLLSVLAAAFALTLPRPLAAGAEHAPPHTVRERLARDIASGDVPGAAVARVGPEGIRWLLVAGQADLDRGRPITDVTTFRTGSLAKVVLAIAVMRLVDEGRLALETPIRELLPELPLVNPWAAEAPVTLAHLLEHSAGLEGAHFDEVMMAGSGPFPRPAAILLRHPERLRVRWRPGSRPAYNNRGYVVIAHLLERIHRQPYEAVLRRRVLGPLEMEQACFEGEARPRPPPARGYLDAAGTPAVERAAWFRPGADLVASVRDLAALVRFFLDRGLTPRGRRLLSEAAIERMERPTTTPAARLGLRVGMGAGIGVRARRGHLGFGHYGGGYGSMTTFRYFLDAGEGYAILVNTSRSWDGLDHLQNLLVEAHLPPSQVPPARPLPDPMTWLGVYRHANAWYPATEFLDELLGWQWIRRRREGLVAWGPARGRTELVYLGNGRMRRVGEAAATLAFQEAEGETLLVGGDVHFVRSPTGWPVLRLFLLLAAIAAMGVHALGALLAAVRGVGFAPTERAPLLATLVLAAAMGLVAGLDYHHLGFRSPLAVALCGLTWAYLVAAAGALGSTLRSPMSMAGLAGLAHLACAAYLISERLVGLRIWAD